MLTPIWVASKWSKIVLSFVWFAELYTIRFLMLAHEMWSIALEHMKYNKYGNLTSGSLSACRGCHSRHRVLVTHEQMLASVKKIKEFYVSSAKKPCWY